MCLEIHLVYQRVLCRVWDEKYRSNLTFAYYKNYIIKIIRLESDIPKLNLLLSARIAGVTLIKFFESLVLGTVAKYFYGWEGTVAGRPAWRYCTHSGFRKSETGAGYGQQI